MLIEVYVMTHNNELVDALRSMSLLEQYLEPQNANHCISCPTFTPCNPPTAPANNDEADADTRASMFLIVQVNSYVGISENSIILVDEELLVDENSRELVRPDLLEYCLVVVVRTAVDAVRFATQHIMLNRDIIITLADVENPDLLAMLSLTQVIRDLQVI